MERHDFAAKFVEPMAVAGDVDEAEGWRGARRVMDNHVQHPRAVGARIEILQVRGVGGAERQGGDQTKREDVG